MGAERRWEGSKEQLQKVERSSTGYLREGSKYLLESEADPHVIAPKTGATGALNERSLRREDGGKRVGLRLPQEGR